jgi:hypothetical protein
MVQIQQVSEEMDERAQDMTEIRKLVRMSKGSAVHCMLQVGETSLAGRLQPCRHTPMLECPHLFQYHVQQFLQQQIAGSPL